MNQLTMDSKLLILSFVTLLTYGIVFIKCSQGKFEIHIKKYLLFSTLNLSSCCLVEKNPNTSCPERCNIFMEICLTVYQKNPHRYECDIGEKIILTDILGNEKLNESVKRDYSIPVTERWKPNFNIFVKIKHRSPTTGGAITILTLSSTEENVKPSSSWITKQLSTTKDHFQLQVSFRFSCFKDYYGKQCDKFCKPSSNERGYYNCSSDGKRICHTGYTGSYCDKVNCLNKCVHGICVGPNQCQCFTGWAGESCEQCIPSPGCIHGGCRYDDKSKELLPLTCKCKTNWGGMFCNIDLNYCFNKPNVCENGGECENFGNIQSNQQYRCICKSGFKGAHCEMVEDNCLIRKCLNSGTCEIDSETHQSQCICPNPFYGNRCQFNQKTCKDNPCLGSGSECIPDLNQGFRCHCKPGFSGRNCEIDVDDCSTNHCLNGGMCIDRQGGFLCVCPVGFTGNHCQINKNDCQKLSCMNGAKCKDRANRIDCECAPGWTGEICDQNINECAANQPCLNNSTCIDTPGSFICHCQKPWNGKFCELKIIKTLTYSELKKCFMNPCRNNGICYLNSEISHHYSQYNELLSSVGGPYICKCGPGFTGRFCEFVVVANSSLKDDSTKYVTNHLNISPHPNYNSQKSLIIVVIVIIIVPVIIIIIALLLYCWKCFLYSRSVPRYLKNCKSRHFSGRNDIKILNNKLHQNQKNIFFFNNIEIPFSVTKLNNENIRPCRFSHQTNMKYPYPNHLSNSSSNVSSSTKTKIEHVHHSQLYFNTVHSENKSIDEKNQILEKPLSLNTGIPKSPFEKYDLEKLDYINVKNPSDLERYQKLNNQATEQVKSTILEERKRKNDSSIYNPSHISLVGGSTQQNLGSVKSIPFYQEFVDNCKELFLNTSEKSFTNYHNTSGTSEIYKNIFKSSNDIASSSENKSVKSYRIDYNLLSHPQFKETKCFHHLSQINTSTKINFNQVEIDSNGWVIKEDCK